MNIEPEQHREIKKTGHNWLDLAIAVTAILISATSLIVTIVHSRTLERMADANTRLVEANSWPFISYNTGTGPDLYMSIINDGVGPAKIRSVEITWAGRPSRDAVDFLKKCCAFRPGSASINYEIIAGRVLRVGQSFTLLGLPRTPADNEAWNVLNRARVSPALSVNICYCSVFDQCWQTDVARFSLKPRPVDNCSTSRVPYGIPP